MNEPFLVFHKVWKKYKKRGQYISYQTLIDYIYNFFSNNNFDEIWALQDISIEFNAGDIVGIIGRNGAGKTTLLKVAGGITYPTKGKIEICGKVANLLDIGAGFHGELTGKENIYFYGTLLGIEPRYIDKTVKKIIEFSGLEEFINMPVKFYSSGMWLRLALATTFFVETDIILLDEIFAVGDVKFQNESIKKIGKILSEKKNIILFVSHNESLLTKVCTKGILLEKGKIISTGDIATVIKDYHSLIYPKGTHLKEYPEPAGEPPLFIKKITLTNNEGKPSPLFFPDSSFVIQIEGIAQKDINVNVFLYFHKGTEKIVEWHSPVIHIPKSPNFQLNLKMEHFIFNTGRFFMEIHIFTPEPILRTIFAESLIFDVANPEKDTQNLLYKTSYSPIYVPFKYEIIT